MSTMHTTSIKQAALSPSNWALSGLLILSASALALIIGLQLSMPTLSAPAWF